MEAATANAATANAATANTPTGNRAGNRAGNSATGNSATGNRATANRAAANTATGDTAAANGTPANRAGADTATGTTVVRPGLDVLVAGVSRIVARGLDARRTAFAVADLLRDHLPGLDVLTPGEREGSPDGYVSHILHAEDAFSICGVVWRPGQETAIHDHVSWCTFGIISGIEYEILYRDMGDHLVEIGRAANHPGEVSGFAPPGDIHRVRNTSSELGVSLHVYGADVARLGSSIRRAYDLPVR